MKRFDEGHRGMLERVDGEWVLYADHCEAMKRAALTPPRQMVASEDDDAIMDGDPLFHKTPEQIESELSAPRKEAMTDEQIQSMWNDACEDGPGRPGWSRHIRFARAIECAALSARQMVADSAQAEPVAWVIENDFGGKTLNWSHPVVQTLPIGTKLLVAPPPAAELERPTQAPEKNDAE